MNFLFSIFLLSLTSSSLLAFESNTIFPLLQAEMQGATLIQWTAPRRDGVLVPVFFDFEETNCKNTNCIKTVERFEILSRTMDNCHRVHFVTRSTSPYSYKYLELIDHQGNFCPEVVRNLWEMELIDGESRRYYVGNPVPIRR